MDLYASLETLREIERDLANGNMLPEDGGEVQEATEAAARAADAVQNLIDYLGL